MIKKEIPHIHQSLIEKAKRNDRNAQGQLYELYYKAIYNCSFRIVNDSFTAEDLMHDSFIDAFKKVNQLQDSSNFGGWLKRIVINKSIDYLKKQNLIKEKLEQFDEDEETSKIEVEYKIDNVRKALLKLSPNHRIIFSLYMIEGYDHEEIGLILSIKPSTSRSTLTRAKKKLKETIENMKYKVI